MHGLIACLVFIAMLFAPALAATRAGKDSEKA